MLSFGGHAVLSPNFAASAGVQGRGLCYCFISKFPAGASTQCRRTALSAISSAVLPERSISATISSLSSGENVMVIRWGRSAAPFPRTLRKARMFLFRIAT
jgi:hypothetical protein